MKQAEFQKWFDDYVLRVRTNLAKQGVDVAHKAIYIALQQTLTVRDIMTIMEQDKAA